TTGYDYTTMVIPADVTSQARNCFKTIEAALGEGGFAIADIVRATYYITALADADAFFAVCGEVFGEIRPATTLLVVAGLYKPEMKIEIEVTAKRRSGTRRPPLTHSLENIHELADPREDYRPHCHDRLRLDRQRHAAPDRTALRP